MAVKKGKTYTSGVATKINELFRRFKNGEMDAETFVDAVYREGKRVWKGFVAEFKRKFHPHADGLEDELWQIIRDTIYETAVKGKTDGNYFSYLRLYVRGNLYTFAREICFPVTLKTFPYELDVEFVSLDDYADTSSDYDVYEEGEGIPADDVADERADSDFAEIELRDLINKTLTPAEREVAYMLLDGWTPAEIARRLGISLTAVMERIEGCRRKLAKALHS